MTRHSTLTTKPSLSSLPTSDSSDLISFSDSDISSDSDTSTNMAESSNPRFLTAEEVTRRREKNQKKRERKKAKKAADNADTANLGGSSSTGRSRHPEGSAPQGFKSQHSKLKITATTQAQVIKPRLPWEEPIIWDDHAIVRSHPIPDYLAEVKESDGIEHLKNWCTIQEVSRIRNLNKAWPGKGCPEELRTVAPFALNPHNEYTGRGFFTKKQTSQKCPVLLLDDNVMFNIFIQLFENHSTASKFAATCQSAFKLVGNYINHWDMTRGQFNGAEKRLNHKSAPTAGAVLVVSPFRERKYNGQPNLPRQMRSIQLFTKACNNYSQTFSILHLHRVPLLTTQLLDVVIPHMTNLKVLGIYQCPLLHVGNTLKLLETARHGRETSVSLDYYPRFHMGPVEHTSYTGSYGVTFDNFRKDTCLAVWQMMTRILPQAKRQGVDLVGVDTAFRQWLEQTPCWYIGETIHAMQRARMGAYGVGQDELESMCAKVDFKTSYGKVDQMFRKNGEACLDYYTCRQCSQTQPAIFFDREEYHVHTVFTDPRTRDNGPAVGHQRAQQPGPAPAPALARMLCLGCKLHAFLDSETDHLKRQSHRLMRSWLRSADGLREEYALSHVVLGEELAEAALRRATRLQELVDATKNEAFRLCGGDGGNRGGHDDHDVWASDRESDAGKGSTSAADETIVSKTWNWGAQGKGAIFLAMDEQKSLWADGQGRQAPTVWRGGLDPDSDNFW